MIEFLPIQSHILPGILVFGCIFKFERDPMQHLLPGNGGRLKTSPTSNLTDSIKEFDVVDSV